MNSGPRVGGAVLQALCVEAARQYMENVRERLPKAETDEKGERKMAGHLEYRKIHPIRDLAQAAPSTHLPSSCPRRQLCCGLLQTARRECAEAREYRIGGAGEITRGVVAHCMTRQPARKKV